MFKAQKGSKDFDKIVHVKSVVQPQFYEAMKTHSVSVFDAYSWEYHNVGELTLKLCWDW